MSLAKLRNLVNPVGILIKVAIVGRTVTVIGQLHNAGCIVTLLGVEVSLLQHHGVFITAEHIHTLGLP